MAAKCPTCAVAGHGTFTVNSLAHQDPVCAHVAVTGVEREGLSACARCGAVGQHVKRPLRLVPVVGLICDVLRIA